MNRAALLAAALFAAGCGGGESPAVPQGRYIATSRSLTPETGFFGQPVTARVEVVVDRERLDPDRIRLVPKTFPYRPHTGLGVERRDFGRYTRLTYELGIRCLYYGCLPQRVDLPNVPYRDQAVNRMPPWHVYYDDPETGKPRHLKRIWFHNLIAVSNLDLTDVHVTFQQRPGRVTLIPLADVTYRLPPPLLAALILLAAALLLVFPARVFLRWRASRRPPPPPPAPPLPPLERALALVEWTRDRADGHERRLALEELAYRLDEDGRLELAGSARRLAWSAPSPSADAADRLVEEVRGDG